MKKDSQIESYEKIIKDLRQEIIKRDLIIKNQQEQIDFLKKQNDFLKEEIEKLKRSLGLNSSNSGKPPSSDGLKKAPRVQSLREKGKRRSGGQKGHKGSTLKQVENPDYIKMIKVDACTSCNADLTHSKVEKVRRCQVFDIPQNIKAEVTELQFETKQCSNCKTKNEAQIDGFTKAPVQYGNNTKAFVLYLNIYNLIPEDRLSVLMKDIFGMSVSVATIEKIRTTAAEKVKPSIEKIEAAIKSSPVKSLDESGIRVSGKIHWAHVFRTEEFTHYRVSEKRGDIPKQLTGTVCHDHFSPYYSRLDNVNHAVCNAHHLRELLAVEKIDKESWARNMKRLLLLAHHFSRSRRSEMSDHFLIKLQKIYNKIILDGLKYHEKLGPLKKPARGRMKRRSGHNLLLRLQKRASDVLRFLYDPRVPFTNNGAERDLRMIKIKQKVSGGFRTFDGAQEFLALRSYSSTAKKQGYNILDAFAHAINGNPFDFFSA